MQLECAYWRVTDDSVEALLAQPGCDREHALVTLRVHTQHASQWGHEQTVELVDIDGDADGVDAWIDRNEGEVKAQWNARRGLWQ